MNTRELNSTVFRDLLASGESMPGVVACAIREYSAGVIADGPEADGGPAAGMGEDWFACAQRASESLNTPGQEALQIQQLMDAAEPPFMQWFLMMAVETATDQWISAGQAPAALAQMGGNRDVLDAAGRALAAMDLCDLA